MLQVCWYFEIRLLLIRKLYFFNEYSVASRMTSLGVSLRVIINLYLRDCFGNSCLIFGICLQGFLKLYCEFPTENMGVKSSTCFEIEMTVQ